MKQDLMPRPVLALSSQRVCSCDQIGGLLHNGVKDMLIDVQGKCSSVLQVFGSESYQRSSFMPRIIGEARLGINVRAATDISAI